MQHHQMLYHNHSNQEIHLGNLLPANSKPHLPTSYSLQEKAPVQNNTLHLHVTSPKASSTWNDSSSLLTFSVLDGRSATCRRPPCQFGFLAVRFGLGCPCRAVADFPVHSASSRGIVLMGPVTVLTSLDEASPSGFSLFPSTFSLCD